MKKMFLAFILLLSFSGYSHAQATPKAKKPAATAMPAKPATTASPTKKDGSPDMRYKSNKDAAKTAPAATVHTKKDGTPDKRYKENKK